MSHSLLVRLKKHAGRNNTGRIMVRHRGGGAKRLYRVIDFKRNKEGIPAVVRAIEYDPNRSCNIALLFYKDGDKRYILSPEGLKIGDTVVSGDDVKPHIGNASKIKNILLGSIIHNVELYPSSGGKLVRSAGVECRLMSREGDFAILKMPSGEVRKLSVFCRATIGKVGNSNHRNVIIGKAGRNRWLGIRPTVRGTAMNSVDHPHGGGRGKSKGGNHPSSPTGVLAKGFKTRRKKKYSDSLILRRRTV